MITMRKKMSTCKNCQHVRRDYWDKEDAECSIVPIIKVDPVNDHDK